ncbi:hypothetical protein ANTPLA_LOCUS7169 [Anthophora plagiata]
MQIPVVAYQPKSDDERRRGNLSVKRRATRSTIQAAAQTRRVDCERVKNTFIFDGPNSMTGRRTAIYMNGCRRRKRGQSVH